MRHWLIKSAIQRTISFLPWCHWWNERLQTWVTRTLDLSPERFTQRLEYCQRHLEHFFDLRPQRGEGFSVLELGTGWYPVVPAGLYLCGATEIWTIDIAPHLRPDRVVRALRLLAEYAERGQLQKYLPQAQPGRMAALRRTLNGAAAKTGEALLKELNIHVLVRDAQNTGLGPASIDLFVSNGVLEYIPRQVVANMLAEFKRLAKPGAVFSHFINLSDEYAQFDRSISQFNFLKYSDRQWRWLDSPLTPKSRLRISDYRELFAQTGCRIIREDDLSGAVCDLEGIRLAPRFQSYSQADLLVLRSWLAGRF